VCVAPIKICESSPELLEFDFVTRYIWRTERHTHNIYRALILSWFYLFLCYLTTLPVSRLHSAGDMMINLYGAVSGMRIGTGSQLLGVYLFSNIKTCVKLLGTQRHVSTFICHHESIYHVQGKQPARTTLSQFICMSTMKLIS
jgi:hypothetical protein